VLHLKKRHKDIGKQLGLGSDETEAFGPGLAKFSWKAIERFQASSKGKLVLVTAMTPTKYGEGKTTTSIGLSQGLALRGKRAVAALREPSLGPVFGAKGGGTGGGRASLEPSTRINLHCTGDLHAISAANNLLAALVDNAMYFDTLPNGRRFKQVLWRRCVDMNDRFLRETVVGLGGSSNGIPRETGFDITAASEVMATLCLSSSPADLRVRLARLIVGVDTEGQPVTAGDIGAVGGMCALLADAMRPNLVQTTEGVPVVLHGGPFANIAHGCNSLLATQSALALGEIAVTEAGFGFDLGGEKFLDLKCRTGNLWPDAVVLVVTVRSLRFHGGEVPGEAGLQKGFENVRRHLAALKAFGLVPVVSLNVFATDSEADLALAETLLRAEGVTSARHEGFARGGEGALALSDAVEHALKSSTPVPRFMYHESDSLEEKLSKVARGVYGAAGLQLTQDAKKDLSRLRQWKLDGLPPCIAKTHLSLSDDAAAFGAPTNFEVTVRQLKVSAGAGFISALTGDILTMPGLPKVPASHRIDLSADGTVVGVQ
jgi:formate--tetrahydrofolate ligase